MSSVADHGDSRTGPTPGGMDVKESVARGLETRLHEVLAERDRLRDLVSSIWLYIGRYEETQLTTEQKELLADTVEAAVDEPFEYERWWRK